MSDNIQIDITTIQDNINIDYSYPAGPQGPQGVNEWGTILGTLSTQTDLWKYLSAVGTSNFDIPTLTNYLSTNNILLCSLNVNGQILSAGVPLHNIFLTAETDSQTLTYNTQTELLSISKGNSVSLSSLNDKSYVNSNFLPLSGGTIAGSLSSNTITLSSVQFTGETTTSTTSVTATDTYVKVIANGQIKYLRLFDVI